MSTFRRERPSSPERTPLPLCCQAWIAESAHAWHRHPRTGKTVRGPADEKDAPRSPPSWASTEGREPGATS